MTRFPFAHFARLLPEQWQRDRYARLAFRHQSTDAERLFAFVTHPVQSRAASRV